MGAFCLWTKHSDENNRFVSTKYHEKDPATSMMITSLGEKCPHVETYHHLEFLLAPFTVLSY